MDHIFTLTLIKDEDKSRLLVSVGETPAKTDEESDAIISEKCLPTTYKAIVSAIPNFDQAEDGVEESICHSLEDWQNLYDLDLIKLFEDAESESIDAVEEDETVADNGDEDEDEESDEELDKLSDDDTDEYCNNSIFNFSTAPENRLGGLTQPFDVFEIELPTESHASFEKLLNGLDL